MEGGQNREDGTTNERARARADESVVVGAKRELKQREAGELLVKERYSDFGPTLAAEYLSEKHKIAVSRETLRKWMIEWQLWKPKKRKVKHRQWRERRGCSGQMVQLDTSEHDWFEGRGEKAYLILIIDDATSRIYARFYSTDSTRTNMDLLKRYFRHHGRPGAPFPKLFI